MTSAGWSKLKVLRPLESTVQQVFNDWGGKRNGATHAGVPAWLHELGQPLARNQRPSIGYSFTPDVCWTTHVAELKSASKYEPLALSEVLHHAQCLSLENKRPITPVLVTSYSGWLRRALEFLFTRGLSKEHIRFVELNHLEHDGEHIMWFDEPFADWKRVTRVPGFVPSDFLDRGHWYHVEATNTWYALAKPSEQRPLFTEGPVACFTPIQGKEIRYVFWHGSSDADVGEYYLYDEASSGDSLPPRPAFAPT